MTTSAYFTSQVPDFRYEYHTLTVSSADANSESRNTFTAYLTTPINNVVQAALVGAHIHTLASVEHIYVSVGELNSHFNDVGSLTPPSESVAPASRKSFASLVVDAVTHGNSDVEIIYKNEYPNMTQYIRAIDVNKLTIKLLDENGNTIPRSTDNTRTHLIFKFVTKSRNVPPY